MEFGLLNKLDKVDRPFGWQNATRWHFWVIRMFQSWYGFELAFLTHPMIDNLRRMEGKVNSSFWIRFLTNISAIYLYNS